jgi:TolA-binding protein
MYGKSRERHKLECCMIMAGPKLRAKISICAITALMACFFAPSRTTGLARQDDNAQFAIKKAWEAFGRNEMAGALNWVNPYLKRDDEIGKQANEVKQTIEANKKVTNLIVKLPPRGPEMCPLIREIEDLVGSYPRLKDKYKADILTWKNRAGGCQETPGCVPEVLAPQIHEIEQLVAQFRCSPAGDKLKNLLTLCANNKDLKALENEIPDCQEKLKIQYNQLCAEAQQALDKNNPKLAQSKAKEARDLLPRQAVAEQILRKIGDPAKGVGTTGGPGTPPAEKPVTIDDLRSAIEAFYRGDYPTARKQLADFLAKKSDNKLRALAYFYLGAAAGCDYLLASEPGNSKKQEALDHFRQASSLWGATRPAELKKLSAAVSPRIIDLFDQAVGNTK